MARTASPARLDDIAAAGTSVFGRLGYRRTKMAEVAAAAGMSSGAIYTYVESKEALLHVVFACFFGQYAEGAPDLPVKDPGLEETLGMVARGLRRQAATPVLRAALDVKSPEDVRAELAAVVDELYSVVDRLWPILAVIESCAVDLPELYEFYFERRRRSQLALFATYVEQRAANGHLAAKADPELVAQLATEAVTWFAWHRLEGFDAGRFPGEGSRQTVVDFVCDALGPTT